MDAERDLHPEVGVQQHDARADAPGRLGAGHDLCGISRRRVDGVEVDAKVYTGHHVFNDGVADRVPRPHDQDTLGCVRRFAEDTLHDAGRILARTCVEVNESVGCLHRRPMKQAPRI